MTANNLEVLWLPTHRKVGWYRGHLLNRQGIIDQNGSQFFALFVGGYLHDSDEKPQLDEKSYPELVVLYWSGAILLKSKP